MFNNYLKIALRNIRRHKGFSFINIAGLAIGIACSVLVMIYVIDQLSYDRFHEKADRTYRIVSKGLFIDFDINQIGTPYILAKSLREEYGDAIRVTQLASRSGIINIGNTNLLNERIIAADEDFLKVFSFQMLEGDPNSALAEPFTVILTESAAIKYFGQEDPKGKQLRIGANNFVVTGLLRDVPQNSHITFDVVVSLKSRRNYDRIGWLNNNYCTYLTLSENLTQNSLKKKLELLVEQNINQRLSKLKNNWWEYRLEPLLDIHLHSDLNAPNGINGKYEYVLVFGIIAIFILIIACVNYVNLTTARFANRAKEVGIRKVVGSIKAQLIRQFLLESILICFMGTLIALILIKISLPFLSDIAGKSLDVGYFNNPFVLPGFALLAIILGFFAGIYPAIYLSSFKPVTVLTGKLIGKANKSFLRNGLVVFQFSISIFLLISTLIIHKQLDLFQSKNLGFDRDQILVVKNASLLGGQKNSFKNELNQYVNIQSVTGSSSLPGKRFNNWSISLEDNSPLTLDFYICDYDFIKTLDVELLKGRFFSREYSLDSNAIVLNEEAMKIFGGEESIGKEIVRHDRRFKVIGVVKNFHYESLRDEIGKMGMVLPVLNFEGQERFISVKVKTSNLGKTIDFVRAQWEKFAPNMPFEYSFLDDDFNKLYISEERTRKLSLIFSFLAIFISSLGMFGLASYISEQRTKEIGIRKVLGAKVSGLVCLLSKEFLLKVITANTIAWPAAYFLMVYWLRDFAYRIDVSLEIFIFSALIAIAIALLTVSYQTIKAATANPVDSLRYE
jgi:putative ABC transport system permease protein